MDSSWLAALLGQGAGAGGAGGPGMMAALQGLFGGGGAGTPGVGGPGLDPTFSDTGGAPMMGPQLPGAAPGAGMSMPLAMQGLSMLGQQPQRPAPMAPLPIASVPGRGGGQMPGMFPGMPRR